MFAEEPLASPGSANYLIEAELRLLCSLASPSASELRMLELRGWEPWELGRARDRDRVSLPGNQWISNQEAVNQPVDSGVEER